MVFASLLVACVVVGVTDGDTVRVRCGEPDHYSQLVVRLSEIDAPEKAQPFGRQSKEWLSGLCFKQAAQVTPTTTDRYGRLVARVSCAGRDASAEMVAAGMAWFFVRYGKDQTISALEHRARL